MLANLAMLVMLVRTLKHQTSERHITTERHNLPAQGADTGIHMYICTWIDGNMDTWYRGVYVTRECENGRMGERENGIEGERERESEGERDKATERLLEKGRKSVISSSASGNRDTLRSFFDFSFSFFPTSIGISFLVLFCDVTSSEDLSALCSLHSLVPTFPRRIS